MQGLELKQHKERFEYAIRNLTLRGFDVKVVKNAFIITKNGYTNTTFTELGVITLSIRSYCFIR